MLWQRGINTHVIYDKNMHSVVLLLSSTALLIDSCNVKCIRYVYSFNNVGFCNYSQLTP